MKPVFLNIFPLHNKGDGHTNKGVGRKNNDLYVLSD